jgi:hypothetical protein
MCLVKDPNNIKIGIIGMTEGNGHPYSWSAMFNRFDKIAMNECPFPVIPDYLNKEDYNTMGIDGAKIEMIYCNNRKDAEHVAKCSLIPNIVDSPEEMIDTFVYYYNHYRPAYSLQYKTPVQYRTDLGYL